MSKTANIIIKCPACTEKFEVERQEGSTFVSCTSCDMQIKVSGTEDRERRGQATRKLMAKVNALPTPKLSDDGALSDLSFGRSLPFSPKGKALPGNTKADAGDLAIDDDDDEFLRGLNQRPGAKVEPKTELAESKPDPKVAPISQIEKSTPSAQILPQPKVEIERPKPEPPKPKPRSGERATVLPAKTKDGPVFEGRDFQAKKEEAAPALKLSSHPSLAKRVQSRRERRRTTRKEVVEVKKKDPVEKEPTKLPKPKPKEPSSEEDIDDSAFETNVKDDSEGSEEVISTADMEKVQVDSRGQRRRLKNAPKADVPAPKGHAEKMEPAAKIGRKEAIATGKEKLFPEQEFEDRKVTDGAEWRRHKPARVADPDWEADDEEGYYYEDDAIVGVGYHRAIVLGVGAAMALLGLWAGFQFMTSRMGDDTPAANADLQRPDIAVEARRDWTSVSLLPRAKPIIAKFLASRSNEEALQYVRRANKVSFMMKKHYMPGSFTPLEVVEMGPPDGCAVVEDKFFVVPVTLRDFTKIGVALEIPQGNQDEWKIDWESFAGYSEMSFSEMRIRRPTYPILVRCYMLQDTYHNYDFSDASKYVSFRLFDHRRTDQMWGYAEQNGNTYHKLATTMVSAGSKAAEQIVTLRVRFPNTVTNPLADQVEIVEFVSFGWVVR